MIKVINFYAGEADCILVHFEETNADRQGNKPRFFNLLVDGGCEMDVIGGELDNRLGEEKIQGVVVTHLDHDHLGGISDLASKKSAIIEDAFLLFNKYDDSLISYREAKTFSEIFHKNFPSNLQIKSYEESFPPALMEKINGSGEFLEAELLSLDQRAMRPKKDGNKVTITVLGPKRDDVVNLMRVWHDNKRNAAVANRSSIVLLLEYGKEAVLLSGDGEFTYIKSALERIEDLEKIEIVKAAHHGAEKNNIGLAEVVKKYQCGKVFFTIDEEKYKKEGHLWNLLEELASIKDDKGNGVVLTCGFETGSTGLEGKLKFEREMITGGEKK